MDQERSYPASRLCLKPDVYLAHAARGAVLDQAAIDRETCGGGARRDAKLAVDRAEMRVNGTRADTQPGCDLGVGKAGGNQTNHLKLPPSQARQIVERERGQLCQCWRNFWI